MILTPVLWLEIRLLHDARSLPVEVASLREEICLGFALQESAIELCDRDSTATLTGGV